MSLLGFVTVLEIPLMWIPETILFVSEAPHTLWFIFANPMVDNARQIATFLWVFLVSLIALNNAHKISLLRSAVVTMVGFVPMAFVALTCIR